MEITSHTNTRRKDRMSYEQVFSINGGNRPPQAPDLEENVLGALMLDPNALNTAIELLHEEYFYKPEHQVIFRAIHKLFELNQPVDILTVTTQLRQTGELEAAGGAYHISELTSHVVSAAHIEYYSRVLSEKYISRELIRISTETITNAYDETTDVVDLLDKTEQRLMDINDKNFRTDFHPLGDLVHEATQQINDAATDDGSQNTVVSGFTDLDRLTAGFRPGTLVILAARPAMGKTAFALSMARNIAVDSKKAVAFFSLEMTGVELAMRLISGEAQLAGAKLKRGELNPAGSDMMTRGGNREQEISTISRQLKALSKELGIPVLAMSQLSRAVETRGGTKEPMLSDLRESGAIEQDADIVMFIYRPEYYGIKEDNDGSTIGMADIILAKHRSGGTGRVRLRFQGQYARFTNPEFLTNEQVNNNMLPQNTGFDESGAPTMLIDSKINRKNDGLEFATGLPNDEPPF